MKYTVLFIAEDDKALQALNSKLLSSFDVICAVGEMDIKHTIAMNYARISAVVVLAHKTDVSVHTTIKYIKKNPALSMIPVLTIVDQYDSADEARLLELGSDDYIDGSKNIDNVVRRIKRLIRFSQVTATVSKFSKEKKAVEQFQFIMDNVSCGICALTLIKDHFELIFINKKFHEIIGSSTSSFDAYIASVSPSCKQYILQSAESLQVNDETTFEYSFRRPDDKIIQLRHLLKRIKISGIEHSVFLSTIDDITTEKEAEFLAIKTQSDVMRRSELLDHAAIGVLVVDATTREILYHNKSVESLWGLNQAIETEQPCYHTLKNKDDPCKDCLIYKAKDYAFSETEYYNATNDKHFHVRYKSIYWDNRKSIVEYISDETTLVKQRTALLASHNAFDVASQNTSVSFWIYDMDAKTADWRAFSNRQYSGYDLLLKNVPQCFIDNGYIHPDDVKEFLKMYSDLEHGAEKVESNARLLNLKTNNFNCFHTVLTRLHDDSSKSRLAVGFAENIDMQLELQSQYSKALQSRNELVKGSVVYYELDLTAQCINEYTSVLPDSPSIPINTPINDTVKNAILGQIFPDDRELVQNNIFIEPLRRAYTKGDISKEVLYRRLMQDGNYHWMKTNISITKRFDSGNIIAFICIHDIDIEQRDKLAYLKLADSDIESLSIVNLKDGMAHIVRSNGELMPNDKDTFFPHNREITRILDKFCIDEDKKRAISYMQIENLVKMLNEGKKSEITFGVKLANGTFTSKRVKVYYLDSNKNYLLLIRRDVTTLLSEEQKQKEILRATAAAADEANRAKSEFLSRMSHDMRTPMNAIIGMTYLAEQEQPTKEVQEYLNNITSASNYLLGLINDVLDLSKIECGKIELHEEPFSVNEFLKGIDTVIRPLMEAKDIDFDVQMQCGTNNIIVDKLRFNQIFYNLLSNASKYTRSGGKVVFSAEHIPDKDNKHGMRYHIIDNGIGMSEDFVKVAFEPFSQEQNNTVRTAQGTGLGLAIVKNLVEQMGGSITINSKLGEGTEFVVDLYAKDTCDSTSGGSNNYDDYSALKDMHLMLVDDNEMNRIIATKILEKQQCLVTCATNGQEAIDIFEQSEIGYYDAIIMDVRMPVMDGYEATKHIRALDRADANTVTIFAMTADAFSESREAAKEAGMNEHLSKPINPIMLYNKLMDVRMK